MPTLFPDIRLSYEQKTSPGTVYYDGSGSFENHLPLQSISHDLND